MAAQAKPSGFLVKVLEHGFTSVIAFAIGFSVGALVCKQQMDTLKSNTLKQITDEIQSHESMINFYECRVKLNKKVRNCVDFMIIPDAALCYALAKFGADWKKVLAFFLSTSGAIAIMHIGLTKWSDRNQKKADQWKKQLEELKQNYKKDVEKLSKQFANEGKK